MKNYKKIIGLFLIFLLLSVNQTIAEGKWWEKGLDFFKTPDKNNLSKEPSIGEIGNAFKEALHIGSENVVSKLGKVDGFNDDSAVHIPLPKELNTVKTMLSTVGMSRIVDDLELKLNRAAEAATPKAKELFMQSITEIPDSSCRRLTNASSYILCISNDVRWPCRAPGMEGGRTQGQLVQG